jgi:outer membrane lipoprotein SlyB
MNKKIAAGTGILCIILVGGCSSHPEPIIDMQGVDERALAADWVDCEEYSDEVIIAKGAAGGAVAGAAAGAIGGNVGSGAGYGAVWGATRSSSQGAREKERVFKRCLRGRGYRVLN